MLAGSAEAGRLRCCGLASRAAPLLSHHAARHATVVRSWPGPHNHRQPQGDNHNQPQPTTTMSKIFSWEYLSFVTLDDAVVYKVSVI